MSASCSTARTARGAGPLLSLVGALTLASGVAVAQTPLPCGSPAIGGPPYTTAWVDATIGNDATAVPGIPNRPFQSITAAVSTLATALGIPGATNRGLVVVGPGIYSTNTTGEQFPITMVDWIDVQGIGAKQTVVLGTGAAPIANRFFLPIPQTGSCDCGTRSAPVEVLFDFSGLTNLSYDEMLDGFTLQGGDVQVYAESMHNAIRGRISNCLFDELMYPGAQTPLFGILMVHPWLGATYVDPSHVDITEPKCDPEFLMLPTAGGSIEMGYADVFLNVFNNTFIQSWIPDPITMVGAQQSSPSNVAICDVNDPMCSGPGAADPNTTLRGVGNPNIQSNLIRCFAPSATAPTSLMGIDASDTTAAIGTNPGPTNAFDPATVAGSNVAFCSQILGLAPTPRVVNSNPNSALVVTGPYTLNPNTLATPIPVAIDPGFIGEAMTALGAIPLTAGRDWRLVPDSMYQNAGTRPSATTSILRAANFTQHFDLACSPSSSFDFDGDGYGNPRSQPIASVSQNGANPATFEADIGFDETTVLVDAGTGNDSVAHSNLATIAAVAPWITLPNAGVGTHIYVYAAQGFHTVMAPTPVAPPVVPFSIWPGAVSPAFFMPGFSPSFDVQWVSPFVPPVVLVPITPVVPLLYASPFDGTNHQYGVDVQPSVSAGNYVAEQALFVPTVGPNALQNHMSTMQSIFD